MTDIANTPWKNGIYISDANSASFLKINGQKVEMFTPAILDFPDMEPLADGTLTFGGFGPAHQEVQEISGGIKNNNVEMSLWCGKKYATLRS